MLFLDLGGLLVDLGLKFVDPLSKLCRPFRLIFKSRAQGIILDLKKVTNGDAEVQSSCKYISSWTLRAICSANSAFISPYRSKIVYC